MSTARFDTLSNKENGNPVSQEVVSLGTPRAWVSVDQTGTASITDDFNITSISDDGVGLTTPTMTNAMDNANFAQGVNFAANTTTTNNDKGHSGSIPVTSSTFTLCSFNASNTLNDYEFAEGVICGDQA